MFIRVANALIDPQQVRAVVEYTEGDCTVHLRGGIFANVRAPLDVIQAALQPYLTIQN